MVTLRRRIWRSVRFNLSVLLGLCALGLLLYRLTVASEMMAPHAGDLDYVVDALREAEYGATENLPVYELRRRFRDKLAECIGIGAATRPYAMREMPGALVISRNDAEFLRVNFQRMKEVGPFGDFTDDRATGAEDENFVKAFIAVGLLGVFTPDRPCPKR